MTILITGGLGYIGSHLCIALLKLNYDILIIDKEYRPDFIKTIQEESDNFFNYEICDLTNLKKLSKLFTYYNITHVYHLAAAKSVSDSVINPLLYYENNVVGTINLLKCLKQRHIKNIIFSSTAAVYQTSDKLVDEMSVTAPTSPYGHSKLMIEQILRDWCTSDHTINCTVLRYFNPIGHLKNLILDGDNIYPRLLKAKRDNVPFVIYGDDYNTPDGTTIRDYISIFDVVDAHIKVLNLTGFNLYNIGTGKGCSVLELVNQFKVEYIYCKRREGDIERLVCDASKIKRELGWTTK